MGELPLFHFSLCLYYLLPVPLHFPPFFLSYHINLFLCFLFSGISFTFLLTQLVLRALCVE